MLLGRVFVGNAGEDTISVIDEETLCETSRIRLRRDGRLGPKRLLACSPNILYINSFDGSIGAVDLETGAETYSPVGASPTDCCFTNDGDLLVCCGESDSLWRVSRNDLSAQCCCSFGLFPYSVSTRGEVALVSHLTSCDVTVFNPATMTQLTRIPLPGAAMAAEFIGDDRIIVSHFAGEYGSEVASVFTTAGDCLGSCPLGITGRFRVHARMAYAANMWDNRVAVLDVDAIKVVRTFETRGIPDDMLLCPEKGLIFLSCILDACVDVITLEGELVKRIPVGNEPRGLALMP